MIWFESIKVRLTISNPAVEKQTTYLRIHRTSAATQKRRFCSALVQTTRATEPAAPANVRALITPIPALDAPVLESAPPEPGVYRPNGRPVPAGRNHE